MSVTVGVLGKLLASPLIDSLLRTHPNDIASLKTLPDSWQSWWEWAGQPRYESTPLWLHLAQDYNRQALEERDHEDIPPQLRCLIDQIRLLQISRTPAILTRDGQINIPNVGMSPKKEHEVLRSVAYISQLLGSLDLDARNLRIVDIGAGQGYLTRALKLHLDTPQLLALDSNHIQTAGAKKWEERLGITGSITHKTIHITPSTLSQSIDEWIAEIRPSGESTPFPVLLVALHACGSLTLDILRTFFAHHSTAHSASQAWRLAGIVAVGCCYNLMAPADFPLSEPLSEAGLSLPTSAFHLAAQIPTEWLRSPDSEAAAALSGRKVVWRALLGKRIGQLTAQQGGNHEGTGSTPEMRRVGRLNDSAYDDWDTFLKVSAGRLGIDVKELQSKEEEAECEETKLASQLEILHVLRCLVGPLIESTILLDRVQWIREELHRLNVARPGKERADPEFDVEMINLFDQATGSGRNVALAVIPPRKRGAN